MSNEAQAFVFKFSPLKGAALLAHIGIADSVNDQHRNEFWMTVPKLAQKVRITPKAARESLALMVSLGLLREIGAETRGRYQPRRYRFLFPDLPCVYGCEADDDTAGSDDVSDLTSGAPSVSPDLTVVPDERTSGADELTVVPDERTSGGAYPNRTQVAQDDPNLFGSQAPRKQRKPPASLVPEDFPITAAMTEWAAKNAPKVDLAFETQQFLDHHRAKGTQFVDWCAAWQTWMRNATKWARERKTSGPPGARPQGPIMPASTTSEKVIV